MKQRTDNIALIRELAASEDGVFTSALAQSYGISKHALSHAAKTGLIERIAHGAYRMSSSMDDGFDSLRGFYKLTSPSKWTHERIRDFDGIAVTGATAAHMHGIGDLQSSPYVMAVPKRYNSRNSGIHYAVIALQSEDVTWSFGIPVTTLETTLANLITTHEDPSLVADCFIDAVRKYGSTTFNANTLRQKIGDQLYETLMKDAADALSEGHRIIPIDDEGHLAIVDEKAVRP